MRKNKKLRTVEDVRQDFARKGISVASWARANGLSPRDVYDVLQQRTKAAYGKSHTIAVLLGMKDGEITDQRQGAA